MADMQEARTIRDMRAIVARMKQKGRKVGFVPTMGALHEGHFSLMETARRHCDDLVVSIFVNPTQFGPDEDYESYPRDLQGDLQACCDRGVSAVFAPEREDMYPQQPLITFQIHKMTDYLCGASRTGHFPGVLQVVNKLFNIVEPDVAVFGQKDIQQFYVIRRMVQEFNHPVELVMSETRREEDGLAMSSRNRYLDSRQRRIAPMLYQTLLYLRRDLQQGKGSPEECLDNGRAYLQSCGFELDYLQCVDTGTLQPVDHLESGRTYVLAGAVYLNGVRLIDNLLLEN